MLQKNQKTELAAALFSALGAEVPHQPELEKEAQALLERCGSRSVALKKVLAEDPRPAYQKEAGRVYGFSFAGQEIRFQVNGNVLTVCGVEKAR